MDFIFSGTGSTAAKVPGPLYITIMEWIHRCSTTFNSSYDVISFYKVTLDQSGRHWRLPVQFVDDIMVLVVAGLLAHVYLACTLSCYRIIQLVLESDAIAMDTLGPGSLR